MRIGMIGLGKIGAPLAERLKAKGHEVVGFDSNPESIHALAKKRNHPRNRLRGSHSEIRKPKNSAHAGPGRKTSR